jgi:ferritin-like metal-binding protein YciE
MPIRNKAIKSDENDNLRKRLDEIIDGTRKQNETLKKLLKSLNKNKPNNKSTN